MAELRKPGRLFIVVFILFFSIFNWHLFSISNNDGLNLREVGRLSASGYLDIFTVGDYAYCADNVGGMDIIDIHDPANPHLAGSYPSPGRLHIVGKRAYIAGISNGFEVVDISKPLSPVCKGQCDLPVEQSERPISIDVEGNYAFVILKRSRLVVIDISKTASPEIVGSFELKYPCGSPGCDEKFYPVHVQVKGNYAYIGGYNRGVMVVDVSRPASAVAVALYENDGVVDMQVSGNYLYVMEELQMVIIDISNPLLPVRVGTYFSPACDSYRLFILDNYAYLTFRHGGLFIVDVSIPSAPVLAGSYYISPITEGFYTVFAKDGYAYVNNNIPLEFLVFDVSDISSPELVGKYERIMNVSDVYVTGNYAYMLDIFTGLWIADISDKSKPTIILHYDSEDTGEYNDIHIKGNYAYILRRTCYPECKKKLNILDISNPTAPRQAAYFEISGYAASMAVSGDYIYLGGGRLDELAIVDISNPLSPTLVGEYSDADDYWAVNNLFIKDNYAYLAHKGLGIDVIDVFDPTNPVWAGNYRDGEKQMVDVFVSGNYAYAVMYDEGLVILDISNPTEPTPVGNYDYRFHMQTRVEVSGEYAYLAAFLGGLIVVDISDPASPITAAKVSFGNYDLTNNVFLKDDYVYMADGRGLFIYTTKPAAPAEKVLTVRSSPDTGVPVGVSTADNNGEEDGFTHFTRTYNKGTQLSLTAPATYNGKMFSKWIIGDMVRAGQTIHVKLTYNKEVTAVYEGVPVISFSRDSFNFGADTSGRVTPPQLLRIQNTGGGTLNWNIDSSVDWLNLSPGSGFGDTLISISVVPTGLSSGTYNGTLTVSDARFPGAPASVTVNLTVYDAGATGSPLGEFSTPVDGAVVSGSIPVTGWVVDDLGVECVKIYRLENGTPVSLGDAVFVEGARPDIRDKYPTFPMNYQAGWGYMMLTHSLPGNGNGTYRIRVDAVDIEGNTTTLGVKTIQCDNGNAVKPFGTIEAPGQGGIVSGTRFRNWGWVLTPPPNKIPEDGSSIDVLIDGQFVGHPVYNLYRKDIARLFPGYLNSHGAFGYFDIHTAQYENGVHTIQWVVTDNAGNREGIGSRYFIIDNNGSGAGTHVYDGI